MTVFIYCWRTEVMLGNCKRVFCLCWISDIDIGMEVATTTINKKLGIPYDFDV